MRKHPSVIVALILTAACMSACDGQPSANGATKSVEEGQQDFKTLEDRFSYAFGADWAEKLKAEGIELNIPVMAAAMQTVFEGGEKKMSTGEIAATIQVYQEVHQKKKDAEWAVATEKNKTEGEVFLKENASKEGVVVTKSGLQYKVLAQGEGGYTPTAEDEVKVHYRGRLLDGTEFDSTYSRGEPYSSSAKALIEGWSEALQLMSVGSKWELYVPANLAYGEAGSPPFVGPNAVLIFDVELLEIGRN